MIDKSMILNDKVVIVTGAGSGIGAATAKLLSQQQAKVVVTDIDLKKAQQVVEEIKSTKGSAMEMEVDVSNFAAVDDMVKKVVKTYGKVDVMVNNAGIGPKEIKKTDGASLEDWDRVVAVNQTGVFYCMKVVLGQMLQQGHGNIVNVASLAGIKASGKNIAYSASKFAVVGMTKSAALEYASKNIRINAVCPGYTESALLDQLLNSKPEMEAMLTKMIPMKRFGQAHEIAETIAWLSSDATQFITGQTIVLDGGLSL